MEILDYRILRRLGRGASAEVFEAVQLSLKRRVALKVMTVETRREPDAIGRFLREMRISCSLAHPHVVRIFDTGEQDGRPWFAMELIEGRDLAHLVAEAGPLPFGRIQRLLAQSADALAYIHAAGLTHRDLKPANMMVSGSDHLTLMDFGLARAADSTYLTASGMVLGTPMYLSPESLNTGIMEHPHDIHAFGLIAWELLAGRRCYTAASMAELIAVKVRSRLPSLSTITDAAPPWLCALIDRAVALDPAARPTAEELRAGLFDHITGESAGLLIGAPPGPPSGRPAAAGAQGMPGDDEPEEVAGSKAEAGEQPASAVEVDAPLAEIAPRPRGTRRTRARTGSRRLRLAGAMALSLCAVALLIALPGMLVRRVDVVSRPSATARVAAPRLAKSALAGHRQLAVHVVDAPPGTRVWLAQAGTPLATGTLDRDGEVMFRSLPPATDLQLIAELPGAVAQSIGTVRTPEPVVIREVLLVPGDAEVLIDVEFARPAPVVLEVGHWGQRAALERIAAPTPVPFFRHSFKQLRPDAEYYIRVSVAGGWGGSSELRFRTKSVSHARAVREFSLGANIMTGHLELGLEYLRTNPDPRVVPAVLRAVAPGTPESLVPLRKLATLTTALKSRELADLLALHAETTPRDSVRAELVRAMAAARHPGALAPAITALARLKDHSGLTDCAIVLARHGGPTHCEAIAAAQLRMPDTTSLGPAMARCDPARAREHFRAWLASRGGSPGADRSAARAGYLLRASAARGLAELGEPGDVTLLADALDAGAAPPDVLEALVAIGTPAARQVAVRALEAQPEDVGRIWTVGRLGIAVAAPVLSRVLRTAARPAVRRAAAAALALTGARECAPDLIQALRDPDADVAGTAAWGLARWQCPEAADALEEFAGSGRDRAGLGALALAHAAPRRAIAICARELERRGDRVRDDDAPRLALVCWALGEAAGRERAQSLDGSNGRQAHDSAGAGDLAGIAADPKLPAPLRESARLALAGLEAPAPVVWSSLDLVANARAALPAAFHAREPVPRLPLVRVLVPLVPFDRTGVRLMPGECVSVSGLAWCPSPDSELTAYQGPRAIRVNPDPSRLLAERSGELVLSLYPPPRTATQLEAPPPRGVAFVTVTH